MSWFTVDNTAIMPQIVQLFDYISKEFPTVVLTARCEALQKGGIYQAIDNQLLQNASM
jgi:hypothetical protein